MTRAVPVVVGIIVLLIGIVWASQGAGIMGGSGLMDNNSTFLYLGGLLAVVGVILVAFGALSKPRGPKTAMM